MAIDSLIVVVAFHKAGFPVKLVSFFAVFSLSIVCIQVAAVAALPHVVVQGTHAAIASPFLAIFLVDLRCLRLL